MLLNLEKYCLVLTFNEKIEKTNKSLLNIYIDR